jgi:signal transduction histidine kinase
VKFTPAGCYVTLASKAASDGMIAIAISDNGIGIAPDDQERVFEPFRRGEASVSRAHEGTGLGLTITKRLVELSGGRLALESQIGLGTTVTNRSQQPRPARPQDEKTSGHLVSP